MPRFTRLCSYSSRLPRSRTRLRRTEGSSVNRRVVRERRQESPPWTAPSFRLLALYAFLCGDEDRDSEKRANIGPFEQFQAADDRLLTEFATGYLAPRVIAVGNHLVNRPPERYNQNFWYDSGQVNRAAWDPSPLRPLIHAGFEHD
jgi:hypothetical protein